MKLGKNARDKATITLLLIMAGVIGAAGIVFFILGAIK